MSSVRTRIRQATEKDWQDVANCARQAYARYVSRMGKEPAPMNADFARQIENGCVWVAQTDNQLAGYVVYYQNGIETMHLENVAVLPSRSGLGIGTALIRHVEAAAQQAQLKAVELYTNEAMIENLGIYPKLGYTEIERKQQDGFSRVFFRKALTNR